MYLYSCSNRTELVDQKFDILLKYLKNLQENYTENLNFEATFRSFPVFDSILNLFIFKKYYGTVASWNMIPNLIILHELEEFPYIVRIEFRLFIYNSFYKQHFRVNQN